jgi:lysophospholipase L1-like esterase
MQPSPRSPFPTMLALALLAGCGGGSNPGGPGPVPSPSPAGGHTVQVVVFYDENADGVSSPSEPIRIPNVEITIGGRSARSQTGTGLAVVTNVPAGSQTVNVRADTLPPFYRVGAPVTAAVPLGEGSRLFVPLTLPIGNNHSNLYMAFGDSITRGDELPADRAYPSQLEGKLAPHFAGATVTNRGAGGTNSYEARERLERQLSSDPAYTLIIYGTNDWHDPLCQDDPKCHTVPNLRLVVQGVKRHDSLPMLGTLPPVNPALTPAGRNQWIRDVNDLMKPMASQEGAFLVDVNKAFTDRGGDLSRFFLDDVHLNADGAAVVADAFFQAIAFGRAAPTTSSVGPLLRRP